MATLSLYIVWFIAYSFAGWVWETALCSITSKKFVNRGFLNGPYCPIYGFGALIDIVALGSLSHPVPLFLAGGVLACVLEYLTSYGMEYYFHARWWDYSDKRFNLNGRICLEGFLVFGLFAVALILGIQPRVASVTALISTSALSVVAAAMAAVFAIDVAYTLASVYQLRSKLSAATADIELRVSKLESNLEALRAELKARYEQDRARLLLELNAQEQRLINAFPRVTTTLPSLDKLGQRRHAILRLWQPHRLRLSEFFETRRLTKRPSSRN